MEPADNLVEFVVNGMYALARRNGLGVWCGYIAVQPGHPWCGRDYDEIDCEVHGGLTFAGRRTHSVAPHDSWFVGFDCGHDGDFLPYCPQLGGEYRGIDFVRSEIERMAHQATMAGAQTRSCSSDMEA